MVHGHEVLHMMEGNSYSTKESLVKAIVDKFGADERYYTCSAEGMTAAELVDFLEERGKFMPSSSDDFTVDTNKICNH
ncbi:YecH family metal-binding protein [Prevotella aurantiaca]|uniref:YecH family metal-binding protein n=1 Tax=Prevotella aurantiaca TaxID=596085 RepID=UPI0028DD048F|nr:YecH family metal-binding protein [Prevotella aurantiaca]